MNETEQKWKSNLSLFLEKKGKLIRLLSACIPEDCLMLEIISRQILTGDVKRLTIIEEKTPKIT